jgi:hypothetical protein
VAGPVSISPPDWICPLLAVDADAFYPVENAIGSIFIKAENLFRRPGARHFAVSLDGINHFQWAPFSHPFNIFGVDGNYI